ncbi:hypothetical protein [Chryseobacterium sp.]|uniref:hypothetical protein n=1 Tax=Chryseobacterium sp. TaxID=1871047 RepID=UPI0025B97C91|nr:hypothetical protein [Chryseobacterium sp.]MBV8325694.1 hypothetical protein [Chryseobacterium sp.]
MKTTKAIITMLILVFSLSPCSVKRDVLDIFDIQYISGLNKVKTASPNCEASVSASKISLVKTDIKSHQRFSFLHYTKKNTPEERPFYNTSSKRSTGNSPPKYILFKRLKLNLV